MPYVRPGARPGLAVSAESSAGSSVTSSSSTSASRSSGTTLATSWDVESFDKQLAELGAAGSFSSSASSLLESLVSPSSTAATSPLPSLAGRGGSSLSSSPFDTSSPPNCKQEHVKMPITTMAAGAAAAVNTAVQPVVSSRKAMKAALFQISDSEDGEAEDDPEEAALHDEEDAIRHRWSNGYAHGSRDDPSRRSLSGLSGVTVIGRGSFSSQSSKGSHNREGSTSSSILGGSKSSSRAADRPARSSIDEMPEPDPPFAPKLGDGMDFSAALNLLNSYPRSTSPARNRPEVEVGSSTTAATRAKPPLPRSVSAYAGQASPESFDTLQQQQQQPPLLPPASPTRRRSISPSTSSRSRPRRHSRSSIHERDQLSPLAMSPISGNASLPSTQQSFVSPTLSDHASLDSAQYRHNPASPPTGRAGRSPSHNFHSYALSAGSSTSPRAQNQISRTTQDPSSSSIMSRRSSRTSDGRAARPPTAASSRRPSSASRSVSNADLGQIMRSFSQKPRRTLSRHNTQDDLANLADDRSNDGSVEGDQSASLRRSQRSRNGSLADLKSLIQQKRRQASAPFYSTAPSATHSPVLGSGAQSPVLAVPVEEPQPAYKAAWEHTPPRRIRSRHATTAGINGMAALTTSASGGFEEARLRAMRGMGEVVMTPSVEEWRQLGLNESLNDRDSGSSSGSDTDDESDGSLNGHGRHHHQTDTEDTRDDHLASNQEVTPRPRLGSIQRIAPYGRNDRTPSYQSSFSRASHGGHGGLTSPSMSKSPRTRNIHDMDNDMSSDFGGGETDESLDLEADMERRLSARDSGQVPTLSRNSLSATTGTPTPPVHQPGYASTSGAHPSTPMAENGNILTLANGVTVNASSLPFGQSPNLPFSPSRASSPVPLAMIGPIDPRAYSAVTGLRTVNDFVVQGEAGKGAYGLVRKVREKGADGKAVGPNLMLKYIVKQRILADAYKRHKVLGAIPMEIHVLDFIRRVQRSSLLPRDPLTAVSAFKSAFGGGGQPKPSIKDLHAPTTTSESIQLSSFGHPALCQMLDFFEDAENYYLVMSCFGNGQDLFDYVDAAPNGLELDEARSILRQIVDAVAFLHSHGIVHRDIKDENIILDGKGGVQLIDFGSAAYIKEGKPYFDTFSGTLDFASPEVLRGERYGGKETDIWALGVLAYVILCGECPFWSSEESLLGLAPGSRADEALLARADEAELACPEDGRDAYARYANDAIDFVHQCLSVHARDRPSAANLRSHKFLIHMVEQEKRGELGWLGVRGWEAVLEDSSDDQRE